MTVTSTATTTTGTGTSGSLYVGGQASGIDTESLIKAAYEEKLQPAYTIDAQVEANADKITAYQTLDSLLDDVLTSLNTMRYVSTTTTSDFDEKSGSYTSSSGTSASSIATVAITTDAEIGTHTVEVQQIAKAAIVGCASQSSKTTALGYTGEFSLGLEGGAASTISIDADDSLNDLAAKINNTTATSGIKALVVLVAPGEYQLTITASTTATAIQAVFVSGTNVLQSIGLLNASGDFSNVIVQPQKAIIVVDNVQIERDSNTIDDAIDGVTFNLKQAEAGTTLTLEITNDTDTVYDDISSFVDAYNALRDFVISNQSIANGTVGSDAVLYADGLLRQISQQVSTALGKSYNSTGSVRSLRDIGLSFDASNKLEIDATALQDALDKNYDEVRGLFQTEVTFSDTSDAIRVITNNSRNTSALHFTLDITVGADGKISGVSVGGDSSLFTVSGTRIIGAAGSAYEGLTFAFVGASSTSITVGIEPGLANSLYASMDGYANNSTGSLLNVVARLEDQNADLTARADRIRERADIYREKQVAKYAALETAVKAAETLQAQIEAILGNTSED